MVKDNRIFVDIHVLQSLPASCVNRDESGCPKTAIYGDVIRSRVSSQAWKHRMREDFKNGRDYSSDFDISVRSASMYKKIAEAYNEYCDQKGIGDRMSEDEAEERAKKELEPFMAAKSSDKNNKSKKAKSSDDDDPGEETAKSESSGKVVLALSHAEIKILAELCATEDAESREKLLNDLDNLKPAIDIAMFGRMIANKKDKCVDACCQVAHAISTHEVLNELDFFSAGDDVSDSTVHLGNSVFNSSVLYRYANVDFTALSKAIPDSAMDALIMFIKSFVCSMPTGKVNSYANNTLPELVYVCIRHDKPINLVGAFEKPVKSKGNGYMEPSKTRLGEYVGDIYKMYGSPAIELDLCGDIADKVDTDGYSSALEALCGSVRFCLTENPV